MSILQSRYRLFKLSYRWSDAADHETMTIPSQALLEQACKLWLTVRDDAVCTSWRLGEIGYHMSQSEQTLVDFNAFFLQADIVRLPSVERRFKSRWGLVLDLSWQLVSTQVQSLWASQIYQLQLSSHLVLRICKVYAMNFYSKNCVATARGSVHIVRGHNLIWSA